MRHVISPSPAIMAGILKRGGFALLLLWAAGTVCAREALPESAPPEVASDADMATRFPAPVMGAGEMEGMFLSTPSLLAPGDDRVLTDEQRFVEQDPGFRERLRSPEAQTPRPEQIIVPRTPPTGIPARPL